jgi:hypothetical protein
MSFYPSFARVPQRHFDVGCNRSTPGTPVLTRQVGNVLSFSTPLPPGLYCFRVLALNAYCMSAASNVVSFEIR